MAASALDIQAIKQQLNKKSVPTEGADQIDKPLIVVVNNNKDPVGNGIFGTQTTDPDHTKRKEFQKQSRESCGAFCDFGGCSFHGVSSCLILYFICRGLVNICLASVLLNLHCSDDNLHDLDNPLGADFPYACSDFHTELYLQLFDGIFGVVASFVSIIGLITLNPLCIVPVIVYGVVRVIYLLILIFMYSNWINVGAIIGVLFSIGWTMVFYNTYKIMRKVNIEWPAIEMMKPAAQNL
eukprot:90726_1